MLNAPCFKSVELWMGHRSYGESRVSMRRHTGLRETESARSARYLCNETYQFARARLRRSNVQRSITRAAIHGWMTSLCGEKSDGPVTLTQLCERVRSKCVPAVTAARQQRAHKRFELSAPYFGSVELLMARRSHGGWRVSTHRHTGLETDRVSEVGAISLQWNVRLHSR